jgi:hypothetical protein
VSPPRPVTWGTSDQRRREKWALGFTVGAVVFVASYGGQRLFGLLAGEPTVGDVIRTAHTPFFWRVALAALHAALAVPLAALLVPEAWARPLLRFGPLWVIGPVMVLALAMVAFP